MGCRQSVIIRRIEALYQVHAITQITMGGSCNLIFEGEKNICTNHEKYIIIRVTPSAAYKCGHKHIDVEMHWLNYLSERMSGFSLPIKSSYNRLYEIIVIENDEYMVCAFEKAQGSLVDPNNASVWNEELFYQIGLFTGELHKNTQLYVLHQDLNGLEWYQNFGFYRIKEGDAFEDTDLSRAFRNIVSTIRMLPKDNSSYGLIHNDLHQGNYYVNQDGVTVFDFDDAVVGYYVCDIAIALFHAVSTIPYEDKAEQEQFAKKFLRSFLKGYIVNKNVNLYWLTKLDVFLKYRGICTYSWLSQNQEDNTVYMNYLNWLKGKLIDDIPLFKINYPDIISYLAN